MNSKALLLSVLSIFLLGAILICFAELNPSDTQSVHMEKIEEIKLLKKIAMDECSSTNSIITLVEIALDKKEYFRPQAVAALGTIGRSCSKEYHKDVVPVLIMLLNDSDRSVRREAAISIGEYGEHAESAIPELLTRISKDRGLDIETFSVESLGKIGENPELVIPTLAQLIPNRDPKTGKAYWSRGYELDAIGNFGNKAIGAVPKLVTAMNDPEDEYALRAASALAKVDPQNESLASFLQQMFDRGNYREKQLVLVAIRDMKTDNYPRKIEELVLQSLAELKDENLVLAQKLEARIRKTK